jgi:release factor glutamine methyltransferase
MIYSPREDSFLLEKEVKKYAKGKSFLDLGAGSGIQAKAAKSVKAKSILCADVNEEALKELKSQGFIAIKSDLFSNIKESFDLIAFNPPYLPENKREDTESALTTTGGKKGDEIIIKFLKEVKNHLNQDGIILLVVSSLTPKEKILKILEKNSLRHEVISSQKFFFETLEVWKIKIK